MPSSLNLLLSLALVYSTNPPVSVCGTGIKHSCRDLTRVKAGSLRTFSWKLKITKFPSKISGSSSPLDLNVSTDFPIKTI
ncbi:hypothetical protein COS55_01540 [Candidatus Shapirobacteria bacterium CG03_land_8_20_14_0_80_40_19]|uniref:Uncharacterized protein n=1 Tax=Candidatus Shapirobacteria bacterium CG03_land_8_20_14_0_80_40_19 TaxID=1974880 RepID=A0A2M7BEU7_9BACT|nr:MAG: hypothetical protein COS55_01540 [Candidatus Shapirobacteria bacterium CG03_land_8_20_14_0_80_40_19]